MQISKNAQHLLIVDDDERIRSLLQKYLVEHGYFTSSAKDVIEAGLLLQDFQYDLIILDLMMPGETGLEFARRLRNVHKNFIPIIMLTAMGETEDRINGLEVGADDYLVKPFEPKELLLRISNIIKRKNDNKEIFYFGNFSYNSKSQSLLKQDQDIFLTNSDHNLLGFLLKNTNVIVSREALARELNINERSVDVQIVRLRGKIETAPSRPIFLQTIRGQGYIFNCH
jgi:two-component system phosphate regulon response regulator OmpR